MPTITINRKEFDKLMGKAFSDEKLSDRISMLGTDLEKLNKNEIVVEIFPNRPDLLSVQGFTRALKSFMGITKGLSKFHVTKSNDKVIIDKSVNKIRPYTVCAVVKELKFDNQKIKDIIQIQEKLHTTYGRNRKKAAIGVYPLEKIKFPITYLAKSPKDIKFRPLEFPKEITGLQMLSQHPAGREYGHLLEGKDMFPIFVDANNNVLSMPPIINSHLTGKISEKTKDVFVECSGFDLDTLELCLNMIVTALSDMGGKIYSTKLQYNNKTIITPNLEPKKWKINLDFINKWLGLELKDKDFKKYLEKMGFGYQNKTVLVPAYRSDIMHEVDFAEDIAIAYGYENFNEEIPNVSTIGEEDSFEIFKRKISEVLVGLGLLELNSYNLTSKDIQNKFMNVKFDLVEMESAVSTEFNVLRSWMIPGLLNVLKNNKHHEYPQRIFDVGIVFKKDKKSETGVKEMVRLAVGLCEDKADFTKIKQAFDYLMRMLDVKYEMKDTDHKSFISGRVARVSVKGKDVAYIGEMHPEVLTAFDLDTPVAAFELNLSDLFGLLK
tara:strand:- start:3023 stop:4672 length:1650 start_codon:yes stop_codon:yes gene_type:complete